MGFGVSMLDELTSLSQAFRGNTLALNRLSTDGNVLSPSHLFLTSVFSTKCLTSPVLALQCSSDDVVNVVPIVLFCNGNGDREIGWCIPLPYSLDWNHAPPPPYLYISQVTSPLSRHSYTLVAQSLWFACSAEEWHYNSMNGDSVNSSRTLPPRSSPLHFHP